MLAAAACADPGSDSPTPTPTVTPEWSFESPLEGEGIHVRWALPDGQVCTAEKDRVFLVLVGRMADGRATGGSEFAACDAQAAPGEPGFLLEVPPGTYQVTVSVEQGTGAEITTTHQGSIEEVGVATGFVTGVEVEPTPTGR